MSKALIESKKNNKIHKLSLIIKKEDTIKTVLNYGMFCRLPGVSGNLIQDVIYTAQDGDFLQGKYPGLRIINKFDVVKSSSRTTAAYTKNGLLMNLTSDAVVQTIGQESYDQAFASLCCNINQEIKIKGILSLLTHSVPANKKYSTQETQTYDSSFTHLLRLKQRTRSNRRKKVRSYIIQEPTLIVNKEPKVTKLETVSKRVLIDPTDFMKSHTIKVEPEEYFTQTKPKSNVHTEDNLNNRSIIGSTCNDIHVVRDIIEESTNVSLDKTLSNLQHIDSGDSDLFPDLKSIVEEDANISDVSSVSNLSIGSASIVSDIATNVKSIFKNIKEHTELKPVITIVMLDESTVTIKGNPDPFHLATPEILKDLSATDQKKIMLHQAYLDWKYCLQRNEDDNLPIHIAVLNNDVELLKRQCLVLKSRNHFVDIPAAGNLTALQMSIHQDTPECTKVLLLHGADILVKDDEARTALHLAAEVGAKHVEVILEHCKTNARNILKEDDLWKPEFENKSDTKLVNYLLTHLNTICDNQGYTPLMLASKMGNADVVEVLVDAAPSAINMVMPNCGNTALYLAVGAAYTEAANRGDKTTIPENYKRIVGYLVENGADPAIENNSGSTVTVLLTELHEITLSFLIAKKLAARNGYLNNGCNSLMLVKDAKGTISVKDIKKNQSNQPSKISKVYKAKTIKNLTGDAKMQVIDTKNEKSKATISNEIDQKITGDAGNPVIIKNLPVVTKMISFGKEKPVLVTNIVPKKANNKGLKTQITATTNTKVNAELPFPLVPLGKKVGSNKPQFLKILPKSEHNKPLLILNRGAIKRPNDDNTKPSSSKIAKKY